MSTPTIRSKEIPSTYDVLAAMSATGVWYIRKRGRSRPALWCAVGRGAFVKATPRHVERWLCARYPAYRTATKRYLRNGALEVLCEAWCHPEYYRLPVLDEDDFGGAP